MDTALLKKAASQAKTGWLEAALKNLLPQVWDLSSDRPNWQAEASTWASEIDQMFAEQKLRTPEQQKNRRTDIANALRTINPAHPAISYILLPTQVYTELNNKQASLLSARENKFFTSDEANSLVERAIALLDYRSPDEWAAGVAVLVGRRISEILLSQFQPKTAYSLLFSEAVKRRGETGLVFEIPTLAAADRVLEAIAKIKQVWNIEALKAAYLPDHPLKLKRQINAKYSGVPKVCRQYYADLVPGREAETDLGERFYTHLLRGIYAEIATYYYKPEWVPDHRFKAEIQGHFKLTGNGEKIPNYAARQNYDDYLIRDRLPGQSGVKLGQPGVEILEVFRSPMATARLEIPEIPETLEIPGSTDVAMDTEDQMEPIESPPLSPILEPGTINALLYRAVDRLLNAKQWADVATGLMLVTGRTVNDLITADFAPKTAYSVQVDGLEIPTLTAAEQVLHAWEKLHTLHPEHKARIEPTLQQVSDRTFHDLVPLHSLEDLRAIYSCIAVHWFCPPGIAASDFLRTIHAAAPQSFQTANPNLGIKLAQRHVQVLEAFKSPQSTEPLTPNPATPTQPMTSEPAPTRSHHRRKSLSVDADLLREVATLYGIQIRGRGTGGFTYEAALHELLSYLLELEEEEAAAAEEPDVSPYNAIADQAKTMAWFTARIESLEATVATLQAERDAAIAQLQQAPQQLGLERLQQENIRLKQERDQAIHKLDAFRNLLNGGGMLSPTGSRPEPPPVAVAQSPQPLPPLPSVPSEYSPQGEAEALRPTRRRLSSDRALDNIRDAIRAIMKYNDQGDRARDEKWYISFPALQALLRENGLPAHQKNVAQVFQELQAELEQHHERHNIQSRHNRKHPDITKIAQVIPLEIPD